MEMYFRKNQIAMKLFCYALLASMMLALTSCDKSDDDSPANNPSANPSLNLSFRFQVDGPALQFDTIAYENEAHNHYSVHTLEFYISQLSLVKSDNSTVAVKDWIYVDARETSTLDVVIKNIPKGCYTGMTFNIGIDSAHNVQDGLPATPANLMMEWPGAMGGGYHFIKLEGYFADSSGTPGYAMHIGTNSCLIPVQLPVSICFDNADVSRTLVANINEWFRNPETYDLNIDGNYIMGNMAAMSKFAANGADVFTLQ